MASCCPPSDSSPSQTWSPRYGMLEDRFGTTWVLDVAVPYKAQ
ncbi:hypothetical protein [Hyalangium gracile]|nr:hypothetical protein [Hyalangium gracile]